VKRWCGVVDEPFRARKAAKRTMVRKETTADGEEEVESVLDRALPLSKIPTGGVAALEAKRKEKESHKEADKPGQFQMWDPDDDDEEALNFAAAEEAEILAKEKRAAQRRKDDELSGGVAAALAKLREK
jgi:DNA excision repair protein ERCC-1